MLGLLNIHGMKIKSSIEILHKDGRPPKELIHIVCVGIRERSTIQSDINSIAVDIGNILKLHDYEASITVSMYQRTSWDKFKYYIREYGLFAGIIKYFLYGGKINDE